MSVKDNLKSSLKDKAALVELQKLLLPVFPKMHHPLDIIIKVNLNFSNDWEGTNVLHLCNINLSTWQTRFAFGLITHKSTHYSPLSFTCLFKF